MSPLIRSACHTFTATLHPSFWLVCMVRDWDEVMTFNLVAEAMKVDIRRMVGLAMDMWRKSSCRRMSLGGFLKVSCICTVHL